MARPARLSTLPRAIIYITRNLNGRRRERERESYTVITVVGCKLHFAVCWPAEQRRAAGCVLYAQSGVLGSKLLQIRRVARATHRWLSAFGHLRIAPRPPGISGFVKTAFAGFADNCLVQFTALFLIRYLVLMCDFEI